MSSLLHRVVPFCLDFMFWSVYSVHGYVHNDNVCLILKFLYYSEQPLSLLEILNGCIAEAPSSELKTYIYVEGSSVQASKFV
jgi:hypothetical protein